jgi:hypothetical protein
LAKAGKYGMFTEAGMAKVELWTDLVSPIPYIDDSTANYQVRWGDAQGTRDGPEEGR